MSDEKYRVLILDDDYQIGELLQEFLQNTNKCIVTFVTTETDFWDSLRQDNFDILFLDYKLPETNGLDILGRMSQAGYDIPSVMMTGAGNENIAARSIQSGALDYLVKGDYSFTALLPLIHKAVRLREMQRAMQQYLEQIRYQALLLDNMRDAVVVWGLDGAITYWNVAAEQLYGAPAAERLGLRVCDVYFLFFDPPFSLPDLGQSENLQIEHRFELPDKRKIWISAHITALFNDGNRNSPIGYMNVARDITPRKLEQEALVKSQHFIKRILDTSPNIIYILNLRSRRFTYVNPEIKAILGYHSNDFVNTPFDSFTKRIHPEDRQQMVQHLLDLQQVKDGEVKEIEYRLNSQKQQWIWLKSRETVFSRSKDGSPAEIIGVLQDITANKQAEEKLQRRLYSEKLLSTISNNFINLAPPEMDRGITFAMELVALFIQVNYSALFLVEGNEYVIYDRTNLDSISEEIFAQLGGSFRTSAAKWLLPRLKRQEVIVLNRQNKNAAKSTEETQLLERIGLYTLILIPMVYNNELYGMLSFGTDQPALQWTEDDMYVLKTFGELMTNALIQKQVGMALRKSEARYRAIVEEHQTEMICRFLPDSKLTFVNEAYCRYYGQDRSQLVETSFLDPVLEEEKNHVWEQLSIPSQDTPVHHFEQRVRLSNGKVRWQEWVQRAIFDQHNDFIEFQAVGRDITDRKIMEEQVRMAQTRLTQAARLSSIGELASGVAHQISNPLTTIIADAQLLNNQLENDDPGRESAEAIVKAGWRAQKVINELMKFAQPEQVTFETVSINETIESALLLASAHIQAFGVTLEVDLDPNLPSIEGNSRQLTDLWVNLLLLARSSFTDGMAHTIRIHTRQQRSNIQVDLSDDGVPIPAEQFEKIFEPQLLPTGTGRGTGIELSICQEIVRQNHGHISISGNGSETTMHIAFPTERGE